MRSLPSVSVIVVTRDRPQLLADALASVAAQSPPPLEVRVGDDGGGASTAVVERLALLEVTVLPSSFGHPGAARNAAAIGARGEVLAFLDDDDLWRPGHLSGLAAAFADDAVGFAWRDCEVVRETLAADGRRTPHARRTLARDWDDALMRSDDYLPPSSWGVRRELFERLGGFDPAFRCSEDWDFALRAAAVTHVHRVPGVTVEVRLRDTGNLSAAFSAERLDGLRRLGQRHGFATPPPKTFWEVALALGEAAQP
jgi:glycosyltransferase involved in cell wall biosynthesis